MPESWILEGPKFLSERGFAIHHTERNDGSPFGFRRHGHDGLCDLTFMEYGDIQHHFDDATYDVSEHQVCWIREADFHRVSGKHFGFYNVNVPMAYVRNIATAMGVKDEMLQLETQHAPPVVDTRQGDIMLRLCKALFQSQRDPHAQLDLAVLISAFIKEFVAATMKPREQTNLPDWLHRTLLTVEQQEGDVTLADLVAFSHRSPEHLSRSFKKYLDMTPSTWLNKRRLKLAALLLASSNRDALDICYSLGFNNTSYFYRLFRKEFGATPREYRRTQQMATS